MLSVKAFYRYNISIFPQFNLFLKIAFRHQSWNFCFIALMHWCFKVFVAVLRFLLNCAITECELHDDTLSSQSFIILKDQVKVDLPKVQVGCTYKQLQQFLPFDNFYHRFITNFIKTGLPLTTLTSPKLSIYFKFSSSSCAHTHLWTLGLRLLRIKLIRIFKRWTYSTSLKIPIPSWVIVFPGFSGNLNFDLDL